MRCVVVPQEAFGSVPGLGLVAEHGFYHAWPSSRPAAVLPLDGGGKAALGLGGGGGGTAERDAFQWETSGDVFDDSWKDLTNGIMST